MENTLQAMTRYTYILSYLFEISVKAQVGVYIPRCDYFRNWHMYIRINYKQDKILSQNDKYCHFLY